MRINLNTTFSRAQFLSALCIAFGVQSLHAQVLAVPNKAESNNTQSSTAKDQDGIHISELAPNAPAQYVVKKGDTLWGISGVFLQSAWKWPQLWNMNKELVRNPHWIYPGQTLVLIRNGDRATLGLAGGAAGLADAKLSPGKDSVTVLSGSADTKLSPKLRSEPIEIQPIASVQLTAVEQFLSQPLIIDESMLKGSGYVLSGPENRVYAGNGDTIYARGLSSKDETKYQLYRPGKPLLDPNSGKIIAYEAFFLGNAELAQWGDDVVKLKIVHSKEEIGRGDRIIPAVREPVLNYPPRAPTQNIDARVISSYGGVVYAGSYMVIALNRGRLDSLELGHVLSIWRSGDVVLDREFDNNPQNKSKGANYSKYAKLPDQKYGNVIVFRLFDKVAYALVLGTTLPVVVGDRVSQPQ